MEWLRIFGKHFVQANMYSAVLDQEIPISELDETLINSAIDKIRENYRRIKRCTPLLSIDYDEVEYRYAYIYLYARLHTKAVRHFARGMSSCFKEVMKYDQKELRICSLGGGPGCDVFGMLQSRLDSKPPDEQTEDIHICVVDSMMGWWQTLRHALREFKQISGNGGYRFELSFIKADLRYPLPPEVIAEIKSCDILTMVKFVSVVSHWYEKSPQILQNIFRLLKPGAYIFFVDNSGGGFYEICSRDAETAGLVLVISRTERCSTPHSSLYDRGLKSRPLESMSVRFALWQMPSLSSQSYIQSSRLDNIWRRIRTLLLNE